MSAASNRGKLFVISGPSGTGKGTIVKELVERTDIMVSVSMTTRNPRAGEVEGVNYYFVSKEDFIKKISEDEFLEYAEVYGNYYGTPKSKVNQKLEEGTDVVLEIDIQGALNVKKAFPECILIFVLPPSLTELRRRIVDRGSETEESINLRLSQTLNEVSYVDKYDYCIVNDDLEDAIARAEAIIMSEHSRVSENIYELIEKYKEEV